MSINADDEQTVLPERSSITPEVLPPGVPARMANDRYHIVRLLGEGGQKQVYLAHDARLDRHVVIGVLKTGHLDENAMTRLHREARALARLGDHPHIVAVYDLGEEGGRSYIVAQFVDGGSLHALRRSAPAGRLPVGQAVRIAREVCDALGYAHQHGIIHRDLKPGNIWLTSDGVIKLGDFGLAAGLDLARITAEGTQLGTIAYMAPEQALGRPVEPRSDLYSLGVVLYELVTGRLPFAGDTVAAIVSQHLSAAPVAPSWHVPEIPQALERLILSLLAKSPEDRISTAKAAAQALGAISLGNVAAGVAEKVSSPLDRLAAGVFVGRGEELGRLKAGLEEALSGHGGVMLLVGEPGSGKTSTAEQLLIHARVRGAHVLRAHCYEGEGAPAYWPWLQLLRAYATDTAPAELAALMGPGASVIAQLDAAIAQRLPPLPPCQPLEPGQARFRLFDSITTFLKNASAVKPLVVFLDDLHWADAASLLLLQFLGRELQNARLLVVGTYRDLQFERRHPLAQALGALSGLGLDRRIGLGGLTEAEVARFIEMTVAVEPPAHLVSAVYSQTEGNPFFVKEVVRLLAATGQLERTAAGQLERMDDSDAWRIALPQGVRDVVNRRLAQLSNEANHALAIASVMGREFNLDAITRLGASADGPMLEGLEEAVNARLISEVPGPVQRFRFSHALIRETLYDALSGTRRVRLHRQIGEVLEQLYAHELDSHVAEVANHFFQAIAVGQADKAIGYAVRAAERADRLLAYEEAARQYTAALLALDHTSPVDQERRCDLLLALGEVQTKAGLSNEARESFTRAATLARAGAWPERFARAALGIGSGTAADRVGFTKPQDDFEVALLREALDLITDRDSALRARLLAQLALAMYRSSTERATISLQAVEVARRVQDPTAQLAALFSRCVSLIGLNAVEERLALAREMVQVAERVGDKEMALRGHYRCLREFLELGQIEDVERELAAYSKLAEQVRQPRHQWYVPFCRASLAMYRGQFADSERLTAEALAMGRRGQDPNVTIFCGILMHALPWLQGRFEDVEAVLKRLFESHPVVLTHNRAIRARLYCFMDRLDEAQSEFDAMAANDFDDLPLDGGFVTTVCSLATTCAWLGDRPRAAKLYQLLAPYRMRNSVAGNSAISGGAVARYLAGITAVLGRFDEAEELYKYGIERDERTGARPWLALGLCGYARMLGARRQPGDSEKATDALQQALGIGRELGMAWVVRVTERQLGIAPK